MTRLGRHTNWAGLEKKGEEKLFLTHLLYFQPSAEKRIVCFNLLAEILCSSVCRKWGRLFSITTWLTFLSVSSSGRAAANDSFELSTLCPCPELLFTFIPCVWASPCTLPLLVPVQGTASTAGTATGALCLCHRASGSQLICHLGWAPLSTVLIWQCCCRNGVFLLPGPHSSFPSRGSRPACLCTSWVSSHLTAAVYRRNCSFLLF